VIAYEAFLKDIADQELRVETQNRTKDLFRLLDRRGCRHQALVRHFDEQIAPCRTACDECLVIGIDALLPAGPARAPSMITPSWQSDNPDVFEQLRTLRRELADADGVPAYVVFSDATLREMARRVPKTLVELRTVSGVGPMKLQLYGERFLEVLLAARSAGG